MVYDARLSRTGVRQCTHTCARRRNVHRGVRMRQELGCGGSGTHSSFSVSHSPCHLLWFQHPVCQPARGFGFDLDFFRVCFVDAEPTFTKRKKIRKAGKSNKKNAIWTFGCSVACCCSEGGYDSTPKGEVRHLCTIAGVTLPKLFHTMITAWGEKNWRMIA